MRTKLIAIVVLFAAVTAAAFAGRSAHAQTPAPRVEVKPEVKVDLGRIAPVAINVPDIYVSVPDIDVQVPPMPPMPAIAPIALPDFDFNFNFNFNGDDFWFGDDRNQTEREELRQTYQLSPGARVELSNIDGAVTIDTTDGTSAEVVVKSYSYDANPRKLSVEQSGSSLVLRGPERKLKGEGDWSDGTRHTVRLTLPRRVNLVMTNVRDSVRAGELDGTVKLDGVAGRVGIAQATGSAEIANVSGSVSMGLARLAGRGVSVSNVAGRVTLRFIDDVNAQLQTSGVKGKVYVELPNVAVEGEMSKSDFRAKVGTGGAALTVSDVTGTVRLAKGQTMAEMLTVLKASDRSMTRNQSVNDLALYVSNPQVRQAFVEALRDDQNSLVQMTAARELSPYANEPDVRDAYLHALEQGKNESVRMTAASALARKYAGDKDVRDRLLRDLATEKKDVIRMTIIGAVGKYVDDPAVMRAMIDAMHDEKDIVRARAARSLSAKVDNAEVYDLLLNAARSDQKRLVRAVALDGLSRRIKERAELRELFIGYLDDESQSMQYHALRGLVDLGDAGLKQRLVDKARELILLNYRRNWNDGTVLSTLMLLRKLDPQEADRMLEQLSNERVRSF
jgi:HEAT repeat protein